VAQTSAAGRSSRQAAAGTADLRIAEKMAAAALTAHGPAQATLWANAAQNYRSSLRAAPGVPRARRGLAAILYLTGDTRGAREVMRAPVNLAGVVEPGRTVWEATQTAYGALPRPTAPETLVRYRKALSDTELGWARYPALMALAPNKAAADQYRADMVAEYGSRSWDALAAIGAFLMLPLLLVGVFLLERGLRLPRNRLPSLHASTRGLIVAFLAGMFVYQAITGFSVALVAMATVGTSILKLAGGEMPSGAGDVMVLAMVAGSALGAAVAYRLVAVLLSGAGSRLSELGWRVKGAAKWAVGGYIALLPPLSVGMMMVAALTKLFPNVVTPQNPAADLVLALHGPRLVLLFLLVCVIAPVIEELLFRGLLFRALEKRYGLLVGALAAGLVFGGMHPQLPFGFPPLFVLGVGLCYVYRISGSIVPGILIHAMNNTLALAMALAAAGR
jgi:membrane protease YdiL (CAAX protease family)